MERASQQRRAELFRSLHDRTEILILPNAWDAGSAKLVEKAGAKAIATTSAGVANSLGYADGNLLPRDLAIEAVRRIVRVVDVPVTADIEGGYGDDPAAVCATVEGVMQAGAVGINIEDGRLEPERYAERLAAIRARAAAIGIPLFINARTDVVLLSLVSAADQLDEVFRRARLYESAGADGLFVPGLADRAVIASLCREVTLPVNLLALPTLPPPEELAALGVARISAGAALMRSSMDLTQRCAQAMLRGDYSVMFSHVFPSREANALFSGSR
jgi:2-methylisocitrate lyase-like PEP mutase family enzyme